MDFVYDINEIVSKLPSEEEFARVINLEHLITGIIRIKPGHKDRQTPHPRDEVYVVLSGDGFLQVEDKSFELDKKKLYFVPKETEHYFYGNKEELVVLYFFGGGPHFPATFEY